MNTFIAFCWGMAFSAFVIWVVLVVARKRIRKQLQASMAQLDQLTFWRKQSQAALAKAHECAKGGDLEGMHTHLDQFALSERRFFAELEKP